MSHGKLVQFRYGAFDNFEDYGSDATLAAYWVESGAGTGLATPVVGTDQKYEGRRSLKLALSHGFGGGNLDYLITRTFTGLAPSTNYQIEVRLRRTANVGTPVLWSNGEVNMTTPADNTWGLSGQLTGSTDGNGNLPVRLEVRAIVNGQSVTYWFDEVRIWRTVSVGWPLDMPTSWPRPKPGFKRVRTAYGIEDVWDQGHDQLMRARVRWIPPTTLGGPAATGFNAAGGFREFLEYANGGRVFQFVPDILGSVYYNVVLDEPVRDAPGIEPDVTRTYDLTLRVLHDTPITVY